MFELGSPVGDVKWAPYSSTVFAACTADGKVGRKNFITNQIYCIQFTPVIYIRAKMHTKVIDTTYALALQECSLV